MGNSVHIVPAIYQCQLQQASRFQGWEGRELSQPVQSPQERGDQKQEEMAAQGETVQTETSASLLACVWGNDSP